MTLISVIGKTESEAIESIDELGLNANSVQAYSDTVAAGCVIYQSPDAGEEVMPGSTVQLTVSRGPEPPSSSESTEPSQPSGNEPSESAAPSSSEQPPEPSESDNP